MKPGNKLTFNQKCYEILKKVPRGRITTYKAIAKKLDTRAYRAVGNAMNKNLDIIKIPCHRVINSTGSLGGYSKGLKKKILLLKKEGVEIKNNKIDLKKFGWNFS